MLHHSKRATPAPIIIIALLAFSTGQLATAKAADDKPVELRLLTLGDWGINTPARTEVASAMGAYAQDQFHPAAVLLLGDNFYVKLTGVDDPQIQDFFEKTYDPAKLNIPFYVVMGNHDYSTGNLPIETEYARTHDTRLKIPARWYRLDLPAQNPLVTILMLDSDAPPSLMKQADWDTENKWVQAELAKPHARWLICCAHHDIFGNGSHGDNGVLITSWGTLFKQAHVDFYVCGHEHTLQHLEVPGWPIPSSSPAAEAPRPSPCSRTNAAPSPAPPTASPPSVSPLTLPPST